MSANKPLPAEPDPEDATRFDKLMRALFRVDRRDVPKHEPKKRTQPTTNENSSAQQRRS